MSDWGKGVNNNIGWGQGANNDIGWGSIYDKSNAGETLLKAESFFLDTFTGASLGLSLVRLRKEYTGFCIKVRRSSDNSELDIGFVDGVLDTASLLDFVGSGNGFVSIIYDQVGSNNMTQTISSLQGQIVSNGSLILKGGKPCIIREASENGGYLSSYAPNDGAAVKGVFYVGDNEGRNSTLIGSSSTNDYILISRIGNSSTNIYQNASLSNIKINGSSVSFANTGESFTATDLHFLLYAEIDFDFNSNDIRLGYPVLTSAIGMYTFQELVIFENTDDAVAKENNINARYNNIY